MKFALSLILTLVVAPKLTAFDLVYAVDDTNLILVDSVNPGASSVVGPHGLAAGALPFSLAYDPVNDALVGTTTMANHPFPRQLVRFDRSTGSATVLATLGDISSGGLFEGVEYVDPLGGFTVGKAPVGTSFAPHLHTVDMDGSNRLLATSNPLVDIDVQAWDSLRDRLLVIDSGNGGNSIFYDMDFNTGDTTQLAAWGGTITDDVAYSAETDSFLVLSGNGLYRSDASNLSFQLLGTVPGTSVRGLAIVSTIPEPGMILPLAMVTVAFCLVTLRRRESTKQRMMIAVAIRLPRASTVTGCVVGVFVLAFFSANCRAQTLDWRNTSNTNAYWHDSNNWAPLGPPTSTETARFASANTYEVWWDAATGHPDIGNLQVIDGDVTFLNHTSNAYGLTINGSNSLSDLDISGPRTILSISGLNLRTDGGGQITGGATLSLDGSHAAGTGFSAQGTAGFDTSGTLNVSNGADVFIRHDAYIGRLSGSTGVVQFNGTSSRWNSGNLYIGGSQNSTGGTGEFNIDDGLVEVVGTTKLWSGGTINLNGGELRTGSFDNSSLGTFSFDGGTLTVDNGTFDPGTDGFKVDGAQNPHFVLTNSATGNLASNMSVGRSLQGSLTIDNGASLSNSAGYVGEGTGANGSVLVSGTGSHWDNSFNVYVGYSGDGAMTIENEGLVSSNNGYIGRLAGSTGTVTVTGVRSTWDCADRLYVGRSGDTGTLNILSGGQVSNVDSYIGYESGTSGFAAVENASWDNSGDLVVAHRGAANLEIKAGGVVGNVNASIGGESGSSGFAEVSDNGRWNSSGNLTVGKDGDGLLSVATLGIVNADAVLIGNAGTGEINVGGNGPGFGGLLDVTGALGVGVNSSGRMSVQNGGEVLSGDGYVGALSGSQGDVNVAFDGIWRNTNLYLGGGSNSAGGTGSLTIDERGLVTVSDTTKIWSTGSVQLDGGRFEFGQMSPVEFERIQATSGSMAGRLVHTADTDVASLSSLQNSGVDLREVRLENSGILYGHASLGSGLSNLATGEVETSWGNRIRFAGIGNSNAGELNNFNGVIRFDGDVTNEASGFVSGRGQFAADGGWNNEGVMAFSGGLTDVLGDVNNTGSGQIVTSGGAVTTFYDDVVHNGLEIRTAANSASVFFGSLSGAGNFTGAGTVYVEGDLRPGNSPDILSFEGDLVFGSSSLLNIELGGLGFVRKLTG